MNTLIYIAILPVVLLLIYIYKKDQHKEPTKILAKTFIFGILIVIPAIILELLLNSIFITKPNISIYKLFINVFIAIALVEEGLKWLVVKLSVYKNQNFDETFDGIVYAVFSSLGFACIENILYVAMNGVGTGILRAITAVPLHACTGIIMGYYIGKGKLCSKNNHTVRENSNLIISLLLPTTVHTIYDFLIFTEQIEYIIIWTFFTIIIYIICFMLIKESTKKNQTTIKNTTLNNQPLEENISHTKGTYCRNCGTNINDSNYCPNCGTKNE